MTRKQIKKVKIGDTVYSTEHTVSFNSKTPLTVNEIDPYHPEEYLFIITPDGQCKWLEDEYVSLPFKIYLGGE